MSWKIDVVTENQKILIVAPKKTVLIESFINQLKKKEIILFISPAKPESIKKFDYLFLFKNNHQIEFVNSKTEVKKIIKITGDYFDSKSFDHLLWFCFSKSKVTLYELSLPRQKKISPSNSIKDSWQIKIRAFLLPIASILFFVFIFGFLPFNLLANWYNYQAFKKINKDERIFKEKLFLAQRYSQLSQRFYSLSQPVYLFFGLGISTENLINFTADTTTLLDLIFNLEKIGKNIYFSIHQINKSESDLNQLDNQLKQLNILLPKTEEKINLIAQKAPMFIKKNQRFQEKLKELNLLVNSAKRIIPHLPQLLGKEKRRSYLILFANNREIRPGGGFIGSFAILEFNRLTQTRFEVFDVYDADGQLKIHIEPPTPISQYLNQPHWFLRDSAFSVDFPTNCQQAKFFLEKEMGISQFDGCILITTSAVEKILKAFGDLYLPDFKEKVNSENFYLKAQLYSEKNFFPGSIQKKSFLNSVLKQTMINLKKASFPLLLSNLKNALEEKQIVLFLNDEAIQSVIDSFLWSGRLIVPQCLNNQQPCLNHLIFPFDANLGVNKADYFIDRSIYLKTNIGKDGENNNLLTLTYKNNSPSDLFPGGSYKDYFQIYLPQLITLKSVTKNGVLIDNFDEQNEMNLKKIGFFFEIPPKRTIEIKIAYQLNQNLNQGKNIYQLVIQKQVGSSNKDFLWEINLSNNISVGSNNFSPLVKDNQVIYNTILNTDKIFFIELNKI
jgi:hypothetical protein